jgi:glycosyltransferase involved in cell wall biosynthesis
MHFIIITPSCNQLDYLKRCIASVRDQIPAGKSSISLHHHVQDGGSTDGTREFLEKFQMEVGGLGFEDPTARLSAGSDGGMSQLQTTNSKPPTAFSGYSFSFSSEKDDGMYDALNKGIESCLRLQTPGLEEDAGVRAAPNLELQTPNQNDAVVAWLNCDEQYLEGALQQVAESFAAFPESDVVYGHTLHVDARGDLLSYRKSVPLRALYIQADHLYVHSASMFFRSRIFESGHRFDTRWRTVSDIDFVLSLLRAGCKTSRVERYLSAFAMTGSNLSRVDVGCRELESWRKTMPLWIRLLRRPINGLRHLEKWWTGGYRETFPLTYAIYEGNHLEQRSTKRADAGSFRFSWGEQVEKG